MGWVPAIFQLATQDFEQETEHVKVIGKSGIPLDSSAENIGIFLSASAVKWIGADKGMIVFGSDPYHLSTPVKSIAIQHGVAWDLPGVDFAVATSKLSQRLIAWLRESRINQLRRTWISTGKRFNKTIDTIPFMVCVDYNYYNVCKAQGKFIKGRTWVIPNFADLVPPEELALHRNGGDTVRILFARRFVRNRGTRLIAPVFNRILAEFSHVCITMAGEGPDEQWLRDFFAGSERVSFITYGHHESAAVMLENDIAVIPSLGSEGTSLSAIEAMGAGCVVVATCVGGLTNIIIDDHNGKLTLPNEEDLYLALHEVVANAALRMRLSENAWQTVKDSLCFEKWSAKWCQVLLTVAEQKHIN
jgi:glycosyltransferase involved in cell wall biosynthesis